MKEESEKDIIRRLAALEQHIINLIIPLQEASNYFNPEWMKLLKQMAIEPLKIDDRELRKILESFRELMEKFQKSTWAVDPDKVYDSIKTISESQRNLHFTMQSIQSRMAKIEDKIKQNKLTLSIVGDAIIDNEFGFDDEQEEFLEKSIDDFDMTVRLTNALKSCGLKTWKSIYEFGKKKLSRQRGVGLSSLREIDEIFKENGIGFN